MNAPLLNTPIAIVGMACRLPGADNLDQYWRLLCEGRDAIGPLPADRLDRKLYYTPQKPTRGQTYSAIGGLIPERPIDSGICPLSEDVRRAYDPCHQILCEVAAAACRHAGYDPSALPQRNAGVYIGHSGGSMLPSDLAYATLAEETADYLRDVSGIAALPSHVQEQVISQVVSVLRHRRPTRSGDGSPFVEANSAAALVARTFGLSGPHMAVDAACASSLVAIALAAMDLQFGHTEMAIVGGASFNKADSLILFSHARSCSATGSRPFDAEADGLISSEGYVSMIVKTLDRALADGDTVHAVVRGLGLSCDGRGRSLWAPRKEGQLEAIRRAYSPDVDPRRVQLIDAHATSTQVGDATEVEALSEFFRPWLPAGQRIPLGSVKSNIGHTLETAGLASLLKVVLAMQHGLTPPTIHLDRLNRTIPWSEAPFYVPTAIMPWAAPQDGTNRMAAVNAFGIGGLNVHLVVEQFTGARAAAQAGSAAGHGPVAAPATATRRSSVASPEQEPIAIIGRGVVLPGALSIRAFWSLLASGQDARSQAPAERWRGSIGVDDGPPRPWRSPTRFGGFVRDFAYDWQRHKIPPKQIAEANPLQFMLLDAAEQAIIEANYHDRPFDRARTAVVVGTIFGGDFANQLNVGLRMPEFRQVLVDSLHREGMPDHEIERVATEYEALLLRLKPALLDETGSFTSSTLASRIAKTLDLMGGAMAVDSGDTSSLAALAIACNLLRSRFSSMVLCAGAQRSMDLPSYEGLNLAGRLAAGPNGTGDGFVPGEGVSMLLLKRLDDALSAGDRVLGVIQSIAAGADAADLSRAVEVASRRALSAAQRQGSELVLLAAGCGVTRLDEAEQRGLSGAGIDAGPSPSLPAASLISQIGNTRAAHGIASIIQVTLEMERGALPAEPGQRQLASPEIGQGLAAVSGHSHSGLAYQALIEGPTLQRTLSKAPPAATGVSDKRSGDICISRFGAADPAEMSAKLVQAASSGARSSQSHFSPHDRFRVAIVADDAGKLVSKLELARDQWQRPELRTALEEQGIFSYERPAATPRIAFLFPGQGSQYPGMLKQLVAHSPAAAAALVNAERILKSQGHASFAELAWPASGPIGENPWNTQLVMLVADLLLHAAVGELGVKADCISSHSYGEFPALVAAGAWTLKDAITVTKARADAIASSGSTRGAMLSTGANAAEIDALVARFGSRVYVTHYNAPNQTVVGGERAAIDEFARLLHASAIDSRLLAVPGAFHTPLMQAAQPALRAALLRVNCQAPKLPLVSGVTNRLVSDVAEIRENLVAQLCEPVNYLALIEQLAQERPTLFIEIGPQCVLTRLNRQILAGQGGYTVGSDHPARGAAEQLARVRAILECLDVPLTVNKPEHGLNGKHIRPSVPAGAALQFDATEARRQRMRQHAAAQGVRLEKPAAPPVATNGHATHTPNPPVPLAKSPIIAPVVPPAVPAPPAPAQPAATNGTVPTSGRLNGQALEKFLVNFVVEQTGYPPQIVGLDADLEADLGIDSIKKAQLFGELREYFDVPAARISAMGDFRTLRQVVELLQEAPGKGDWLAEPRPEPAITPEVARANHAPTAAVASPANIQPAEPVAANDDEMSRHLVKFVMEQTGYPAEVITLDADLEADLGIDSIKKAQLFGELREQFILEFPQMDNVALGQVRTLRQVLAHTQQARSIETPAPTPLKIERPAAPLPVKSNGSIHYNGNGNGTGSGRLRFEPRLFDARGGLLAASEPVRELPPVRNGHVKASVESPSMDQRILRLSGSAAEMGLEHGRLLKDAIRSQLQAAAGVPKRPTPKNRELITSRFLRGLPPGALDELKAIAAGCELHIGNLLSLNLSLYSTWLGPCSQLAVTSQANIGQPLLHAAALSVGLPLAAFHPLAQSLHVRHPVSGIGHLLVKPPGQVGSLAGVNARGLTITGGPLVKRGEEAKGGLLHGLLIQTVLQEADDLKSAVALVRAARRVGEWSMTLSHAGSGELVYLEYSGRSIKVAKQRESVLAGNQRQLARGVSKAVPTSGRRAVASRSGVASHSHSYTAESLAAKLRRVDAAGRQTSTALVLSPQQDLLWSFTPESNLRTTSQISSHTEAINLRELFQSAKPSGGIEHHHAGQHASPLSQADLGHATQSDASDEVTATDANSVTSRYVLRMVSSPQRAHRGSRFSWASRALILGDNRLGKVLARRLADDHGIGSEFLPCGDPAEAVAQLERSWARGPALHLFIVTPRDADADDGTLAGWQQRRTAGVMVPFLVCQKWISLVTQAGRLDEASLVAVTSMGGDFGLSGDIAAPEGGAIAGLLKAIMIELWVQGHRATPIKVIDAPANEPSASIVSAIFRELVVPSHDIEIGCSSRQRGTIRAVAQPVASRGKPVPRGGVWVCTGGARGITAYVASELGRRYGLRLHLLGTAAEPNLPEEWRDMSPEPLKECKSLVMNAARAVGRNPLKEWQNFEKAVEIDKTLRDMAAQGVAAQYHACDVADPAALARVLDKIRETDGPISGILHGAGFGKDARFDRKQIDEVNRCIRAKVDGAAALIELTQNDPLEYFIAFGSISGRFGANGHTDYSLANDMLCKQVDLLRKRRPSCAAAAFHWHAWGDVGMATKPETRLALEMINMQFMPAAEGLAHLVRELEAGLPEGEVLITDERYYRAFFPAESLAAVPQPGRRAQPQRTPLLTDCRRAGDKELIGRATLNPAADPFLLDHRLDDKPILPVVVGLELLCEAAAACGGKQLVTLNNVEVLSAVRFETAQPQELRVHAKQIGGSLKCELLGDFHARDGRLVQPDRLYLRGEAELSDASGPLKVKYPVVPSGDWQTVEYAGRDGKFYLGPSLHCLRQILTGRGVAWGQISAPALVELAGVGRPNEGWILPSAALDACLYATGLLAWWQVAPGVALPAGFGHVRRGRLPMPGEACLVETRLRSHAGREARFDFTLFGCDRQVILDVSDYRVMWLSS